MRPRLIPALSLWWLVACGVPKTAPTAGDTAARIDRVMTGLRPALAIKGEAPTRWSLAERMERHHVPGMSIAIIDSGRIVWARGYGVKEAGGRDSVTTETLFQAGSISKPTFAVGVMRLVEDGKLNLDDDVNQRLTTWKVPENKFTVTEKVTLRRLLSHSAGLTVHGFMGYEAGAPVPTITQILDGIKPANSAPIRVDTFPGAMFRYSGGGTTVAMLVVTDLLKTPFQDFMKGTVLGPAGMSHSTYEQPLPAAMAPNAATGTDPDGKPVKGKHNTYPEMSAAGLWTTPSDLAALAIELQQTYAGKSTRLINQATFKQMLEVQKAPLGIGYWLEGAGPDLEFYHGGSDVGFIAAFSAYAERGQGVMIMTNGDNGGNLIAELIPSIADEFRWPSHHPSEKVTVTSDPKVLAEVAGTYRLATGGPTLIEAAMTVEGGKLFAEAKGGLSKDELLADSDSTFFTRTSGIPIVFERDATKKVTGVTIDGAIKGKKVK